MSHNNQPEYFVISSVCPHTGNLTQLGIFEDMKAVSYRLQRCYTSCGDEYRIECFHLSTAEDEAVAHNDQIVRRAEYQKEERDKEAKLKEYDEWKGQIKKDLDEDFDEEGFQRMMNGPALPNINAEYKTVEA